VGPAAAASDPALRAERAAAWRNINRAMAGLPEKQRRVFVLKEVEGFQQAEIARMLGIPVGTVKSLLHRAVKRLQRELTVLNPGGKRVKCDAKILSV
jgi:RNA polymerase sigma-70 factor (ECF subfamily)